MQRSSIVDLSDTIGNTPMVRLASVEGLGPPFPAEVLGKLEYMNPGASIKDRVAKHILRQLAARGVAPDAPLVVAGSGNLAISLSMFRSGLVCLVPERTSADRIRMLRAAGVSEIIRTLDGAAPGSPEHPSSLGRRMVAETPGAVYVDEESGEWDLGPCYAELGAEILGQTAGRVDAVVVGVDTGNAATHLSRALKEAVPGVEVVGVEPANSTIAVPQQAGPLSARWLCEDIGRAYPPRALAADAVDLWVQISDQVAYSMARRLVHAGIHAGPSAGAAVAAARSYAALSPAPAKRIVVVVADSARNYSGTLLDDDWLLAHDLLDPNMLRGLQAARADQYRAASVEDLQLPEAVAVAESDSVARAVAVMLENDFSQVPVTADKRKLVGYLTLAAAHALLESGAAQGDSPVGEVMLKFARSPSGASGGGRRREYWLITPETPLNELSLFFEAHSVAFITDFSRKFCLGIATKQDLIAFLMRRGTHEF